MGAPASRVIGGCAGRFLIGSVVVAALAGPPLPARAAASALVPNAGCRDGNTNGAYELRMRNGRVRVVGAFHDGKRTGTFIFWNESGARVAAIPYDENVRNGTIALWYVGGRPPREIGRKLEAPVVKGQAHGLHRAWHPNGRLEYEANYDHDRLTAVTAWDANGARLADADAHRVATAARKRDDAYLASLEKIVADHQPRCDDSMKAELQVLAGTP